MYQVPVPVPGCTFTKYEIQSGQRAILDCVNKKPHGRNKSIVVHFCNYSETQIIMNASISAQAALLKTVQDIQVRAEVEECLREMLIDVELSVQLQEKLQTHQQIEALQKRIQQQEYIIAETKAVRNETQRQQVKMADALMHELFDLSVELGTLKDIKQQHEQLLMQYDELVAKSFQAEEERGTTIERSRVPTTTNGEIATETIELNHELNVELTNETDNNFDDNDKQENMNAVDDELNQNVDDKVCVIDEPPSIIRNEIKPSDDVMQLNTTESIDEMSDTVVLVKEIRFDEFEMDILMKIFSYLDAIDILNTAQINVSMYSRIDSFFGFGAEGETEIEQVPAGSIVDDSPSVVIPKSRPSSTAINAPLSSLPPQPPPSPKTQTHISSPTNTTSPIINQPTVVELPPAAATSGKTNAPIASSSTTIRPTATKGKIDSTSNTTTTPSLIATPSLPSQPKHASSKSNDSAILNRSIFSLLQPRRPNTNNPTATLSNVGSTNVSPIPSPGRNFLRPRNDQQSGAVNSVGAFTLNTAMADSMASKLSDAELTAIILMTERLKQKEVIADKLTKENETLSAKLDGTEGVKQFLINKVRDMEISLSSLMQNESRVAQQIASDQEVIAFLDVRVQELERSTQILKTQKEASIAELERVQKQSTSKITVTNDMLQFEREKLLDSEREWKMTKKLLIKEVKHCRTQMIALQSERDGYREQNETLRHALQTTNNPISMTHHQMNNSSNGNSSKQQTRDRSYA
jgi:hypothetical protein